MVAHQKSIACIYFGPPFPETWITWTCIHPPMIDQGGTLNSIWKFSQQTTKCQIYINWRNKNRTSTGDLEIFNLELITALGTTKKTPLPFQAKPQTIITVPLPLWSNHMKWMNLKLTQPICTLPWSTLDNDCHFLGLKFWMKLELQTVFHYHLLRLREMF